MMMGKGCGGGGYANVEGGGGYANVEEFIQSNGIDERAAGALREESPAVQQGVLAKGGLSNAQNPSSALMVRIREAKSGGGGGGAYGGGCSGFANVERFMPFGGGY